MEDNPTNENVKLFFAGKRVKHYSNMLQVHPQKIVFKKLRARWGSATKDNTINLNVDLLKAPKGVIDYIIINELCHLVIKEHSYHYWNLVRKFMPDYEHRKRWLEEHSDILLD